MASMHYEGKSVRAARDRFFLVNHFGADGGYGSTAVTLFKLGPLPAVLPKLSGRADAVCCHDLHHVLTGYQTDLAGEFEIAAWELAAGCGDYWMVKLLNVGALAAGCARAPRRTFRAFLRGRTCRTLYGEDLERVLETTVEALRSELGLDRADHLRASLADRAAFAGFALLGAAAGAGMLFAAAPLTPVALLLGARGQLTKWSATAST